MKSLKNTVLLIGNLGKDPEIKKFDNGKKVLAMSLATTEKYKDAKGLLRQETQWHKIVAWGKLAEVMGNYLAKGSYVAVEGRLIYRTYEDKEGVKKYTPEIIANEILMIDTKQEKSI